MSRLYEIESSKKNKRPVNRPIHHADAGADCAAVVEGVVLASFKIDECAANGAVRAVVPRGGIGRRSAKESQRLSLGKPGSKISAVDGVEAGRPGQVKPSESGDQAGVGIVVRHVEMVGAVDQVLQRLCSC